MILNRLNHIMDPKLIPEQAGFRPDKSCCSQVLNFKVTGVVFVDLSAAYDTVNLRRLLGKEENATKNHKFVRLLSELLHNRVFQVHLLEEKVGGVGKKRATTGSVLAPTLFNILCTGTTVRFAYADDLALAA